jgi:TonB family protein
MNRRTFTKLLTLAVTAFHFRAAGRAQDTGAGPAPAWTRYTVKDEEFSVKLPARPRLVTTSAHRKTDGQSQLARLLKTNVANVLYRINSFQNPEPMQSLEEFIEEQGSSPLFDPASRRILTVDGFAGIEYSSKEKVVSVVQFFATEKHLYRFTAVGLEAGRPAAQEFFSSIKLGSNLEGTEISDEGDTPGDADVVGEIYTGKDVDVKARILAKPKARYTDEARKNQLTGSVVLRVLFARNGTVVNISVLTGLHYGLTEQAIAAARQIKFIPAMKEGKPVSMWMQLLYQFP